METDMATICCTISERHANVVLRIFCTIWHCSWTVYVVKSFVFEIIRDFSYFDERIGIHKCWNYTTKIWTYQLPCVKQFIWVHRRIWPRMVLMLMGRWCCIWIKRYRLFGYCFCLFVSEQTDQQYVKLTIIPWPFKLL